MAIDDLINLADKIAQKSDGIAAELYEMTLDKLKELDCAEASKCKLEYSFGKFLLKIKDYEKANKILKGALEHSEANNVSAKNGLSISFSFPFIVYWTFDENL